MPRTLGSSNGQCESLLKGHYDILRAFSVSHDTDRYSCSHKPERLWLYSHNISGYVPTSPNPATLHRLVVPQRINAILLSEGAVLGRSIMLRTRMNYPLRREALRSMNCGFLGHWPLWALSSLSSIWIGSHGRDVSYDLGSDEVRI
jgi:hypothetical protein